jgi:hypothetical protein
MNRAYPAGGVDSTDPSNLATSFQFSCLFSAYNRVYSIGEASMRSLTGSVVLVRGIYVVYGT